MPLAYALLACAVAAEVLGTLATRFSHGFTRALPTAVTVVGVVGAYYLLSLALREGLSIGVAYAIWAAAGVSAVALIGAVFLGDRMTRTQYAGVGLAVLGVVALQLGHP
ncbi:SMR family transporter [Streptomyces sp. HNM0574]|uniref:DMT family transporter n=1 Tax=Streptomyces sp. HNM0574 TaxID=2714954 RepID=UPI00146D7264|nr:SMR family transporter [Streptomyces sp. HNM0574]NLU65883.1 QacE family quaternary ammonium compound efflux SMR transporter [Streptomyces sp. HNM0574]